MKSKSLFGLVAIVVLAVIGVGLHAQSPSQTAFSFIPGPITNCPAPDAVHDSYCDVSGIGVEVAVAGSGAYVPFGGQATAPVTTVFGRKGAVIGAQGDYSYSQLSNLPAGFSCANWTFTPTGLSGTNCTFK